MGGRVLIADEQAAVRLPKARLRDLAGRVVAGERLGAGTLSIAFVGRAAMRRTNKKFLRHDFDTDVLAFRLDAPLLGEIVVSTDYAVKAAAARGIPVHEEIARYVVHGILHLAGYDDQSPAKRRIMWKRQERYLRQDWNCQQKTTR